MHELKAIYLDALVRCAPERLVAGCISAEAPRNVVAIGKCAAGLLEGVSPSLAIERAFVAIPSGYREPRPQSSGTKFELQIVHGGHPQMTAASFAAGRELLRFVDSCEDVLFLISGGGSACVDVPLSPWFSELDLAKTNSRLLDAGLPIAEINIVRKHLSAIKGGRLGARVRGRAETLIYSDVAEGALSDVASGPTLPDRSTAADAIRILERLGGGGSIVARLQELSFPPTVTHIENLNVRLIADNGTFTDAAASSAAVRSLQIIRMAGQIEGDVEAAASVLAVAASKLNRGQILVAGGEVTVTRRGSGRGGRCSELALRFARATAGASDLAALFASSDGVDGNSGCAGIFLSPGLPALDPREIEAALAVSDSFPLAASHGEAIIIPPEGNNLRDLILVARG